MASEEGKGRPKGSETLGKKKDYFIFVPFHAIMLSQRSLFILESLTPWDNIPWQNSKSIFAEMTVFFLFSSLLFLWYMTRKKFFSAFLLL